MVGGVPLRSQEPPQSCGACGLWEPPLSPGVGEGLVVLVLPDGGGHADPSWRGDLSPYPHP